MGVLFAMVGFSYAVATSGPAIMGGYAAARSVGSSTLRFTNPLASDGTRDLGDAVAGSALVRYVRAAGGVPPYSFSSTNLTTRLASASANSTLSLLSNGLLTTASGTGTGTIGTLTKNLSFDVTVVDSFGTNPNKSTEPFTIFLVTYTDFRIVVATLPDTDQFRSYVSDIPTANGKLPITFSAPTDVKVNGTATTNGLLEDVGLSLATDGTIFGKAIKSGSITFTAKAKDATGASAKSRDGLSTGQLMTLVVVANTTVSSDILTQAISVKLDTADGGKDSIKFAGLANLNGKAISTLSGQTIELHLGGYTSPNTTATPAKLDDKGKVTKVSKANASKTAPTFTGTVNSKGQVKITIGKESIGTVLGSLTSAIKTMAVEVKIGNAIVGSEVLMFNVKSKGTKSTLTYKMNAADNLAGAFYITGVKGKDDTKGTTAADSWKVAFVGFTPGGSALTGATSGVVSIGKSFSDAITVTESKNKVKSAKSDKAADTVLALALDGTNGKGSVTTDFLTSTTTDIKEAGSSVGSSSIFAMNVALTKGSTTLFAGEGSISIFPKTSNWSEKNPTK